MMGLDVGRIPQAGDWGAEAAGQRDGGQFFTHSWCLWEQEQGSRVKRGKCGQDSFCLRGQGTRLKLKGLSIKFRVNPLYEAKKPDARLN